MRDEPDPPSLVDGEAAERSLSDDLKQLAEDGRTLVEAEVHYQLSRARVLGGGVGKVAMFGAFAVVAAWFALIALVVGLVIALTPLLTAWGATAAVTILLLLVAFVCYRIAMKRWKRITSLLAEEDTAA